MICMEIFDSGLLGEGVLPTMRHAAKHLLKVRSSWHPQLPQEDCCWTLGFDVDLAPDLHASQCSRVSARCSDLALPVSFCLPHPQQSTISAPDYQYNNLTDSLNTGRWHGGASWSHCVWADCGVFSPCSFGGDVPPDPSAHNHKHAKAQYAEMRPSTWHLTASSASADNLDLLTPRAGVCCQAGARMHCHSR